MKKRPLTQLPAAPVMTAPSILAADFRCLGDEIRAADAGGADMIHIDVMDGHFVPNISMGPPVVKSVRPVTTRPFDVHLMLTHPGRYIDAFSEAGADHITLHVESDGDLGALFEQIRSLGCSTGITLRPGTPAADLAPYLLMVDLILVMTVEPGFGGQAFRRDQLHKIREIRRMIDGTGRSIMLQIDGGIARDTARQVVAAGANVLVAGSSVFRHPQGIDRALAVLRESGDG